MLYKNQKSWTSDPEEGLQGRTRTRWRVFLWSGIFFAECWIRFLLLSLLKSGRVGPDWFISVSCRPSALLLNWLLVFWLGSWAGRLFYSDHFNWERSAGQFLHSANSMRIVIWVFPLLVLPRVQSAKILTVCPIGEFCIHRETFHS